MSELEMGTEFIGQEPFLVNFDSRGNKMMSTSFTEYQRKMWYALSQGAVSRFYHEKDPLQGEYKIKKIGLLPLSFYWLVWTNTSIKVAYLLLSYRGWLGVKIHFLDQMSMWDWYLIMIQMVQEQTLWYSKYPMYENLHRQWALQENIFTQLGRPPQVAIDIKNTDRINSICYPLVVFTGTFALAIQFFFTPKYALNTYAIIPDSFDCWWMRVIFCIHECLFMYHGYSYQACTMVVAECMANSYQHLLKDMTKTVHKLIQATRKQRVKTASFQPQNMTKNAENGEMEEKRSNQNRGFSHQINRTRRGEGGVLDKKTFTRRPHDVKTKYDITSLINDYRKIIICSNEHNRWIGKWMGGAQAANYAQFVSDVFIMIQLLKEPDIDFFGIFFYLMDACFGMCMLFRMLILLSKLAPASEEFVHSIRCYVMYDNTPLRKIIIKTLPTLRRVAAKLSGYSVTPASVPLGVNVLINYYILAAMWKRPDDPTRRT